MKVDDYWFEFWATVIIALQAGKKVHNPISGVGNPFGIDLTELDGEEMIELQRFFNQIEFIFDTLGDSEYADPSHIIKKLFPLMRNNGMQQTNLASIFADLSAGINFKKELENCEIADTWHYNHIVPQDVFYMLNAIYKNESVKKMVSTAIYNHICLRIPSVNLIVGHTASGKTQIFRELSKIYENVRIIDATKLQNTGFTKNGGIVLADLFKCKNPYNQIFVWDEFDKICTPLQSSNHGDVHQNLLNELLKLFTGDPIQFEGMDAPISNYSITHFLLGTFEHVLQSKRNIKSVGFGADVDKSSLTSKDVSLTDLYDAGLSKELLGRINGGIAYMDTLTADDIVTMLDDPNASPIWSLQKRYHKKIYLSNERKHQLALDCISSGIGIRYIENQIIKEINAATFDNPDQKSISL